MRGRHKRSKSEVIVCAKTSPLVRSFWAQFGLQFGLPHHADLDQVHLVYCAVTYDAAGGGFRASHVLGSMQGLLPLLIRQRAAVVRVDGNARQVSERPVVQCPSRWRAKSTRFGHRPSRGHSLRVRGVRHGDPPHQITPIKRVSCARKHAGIASSTDPAESSR